MRETLRSKTEAISLITVPQVTLNDQLVTEKVGDQLLPTICQIGFVNQSEVLVKPRLCTSGAIDQSSFQSFQLEIFFNADAFAEAFVQSQMKTLLNGNNNSSTNTSTNLALRDVLQWRFTPWGSSFYNATDGSVSCSTGGNSSGSENSCLANRVLACATRQMGNGQSGRRQDDQRLVNFVLCFFETSSWAQNPLETAAICSPKLSPLDSYTQLWQCASVDSKLPFLLAMKDRTESVLGSGVRVEQCKCLKVFRCFMFCYNIFPFSVPVVSINGKVLSSVDDLAGALCSDYQVNKTETSNLICFYSTF